MGSFRLMVALAGMPLLLGACGSSHHPVTSARPTMEERFQNGGPIVGTQESNGAWTPPDAGKRSSFEQRERDNALFKGEFSNSKQTYQPGGGQIEKRAWWGASGKEVAKPAFATSAASGWDKTSNLQDKHHGALDQHAREGSQQGFATNEYATGRAREQDAQRLAHPQDAETEERRGLFEQPEITNWRQQRGLSVGQTKSMLGGR